MIETFDGLRLLLEISDVVRVETTYLEGPGDDVIAVDALCVDNASGAQSWEVVFVLRCESTIEQLCAACGPESAGPHEDTK